ncbi:MAG: TfoX/Sxy family protein [Pelobium sp.]
MAYNEILAARLRERLCELPNLEEKPMMGGLTFMYNGKMCVGIFKDELMCRIAPEILEEALEKPGARIMDFTGKPMKGYVLVDDTGIRTQQEFEYWIHLCLDFNKKAKASKKKKKI